MSVKNYSPRLLDIFKLASEKEFKFNCKTHKAALALRHRLHALRREMRKEQHWLLPVAEAVVVRVNGAFLLASPPDNKLDQALREALASQGFKDERLEK